LSRAQPDNEMAELFALTQQLQRLHAVTAPERLQRTGLQRALSRQAGRHRGPTVLSFPWSRNLALGATRIAASLIVATMLGYGAFAASAASLPDSPLYQVKLFVEDARVAIAPSDQRPQIYVEQAARRLEETDALIQDGRISDAERAATDAARRIESARTASEEGVVSPGSAPAVQRAIGTTEDQYRSVSRALADRGGSSPSVRASETRSASQQPAAPEPRPPAAQPTAPETQASPAQAPGPERAEPASVEPVASGSGAVGAPLAGSGFAPITPPAASPSPQVRATSEPPRVSAPPSGFSAIGSPTQAAASSGQPAATSEAAPPTAAPTSPLPPTAAPTSPPAPTPTIVPSPTRPPAAPPTRTLVPGAPIDGFTPIPIGR
jgi:hypothetical protein